MSQEDWEHFTSTGTAKGVKINRFSTVHQIRRQTLHAEYISYQDSTEFSGCINFLKPSNARSMFKVGSKDWPRSGVTAISFKQNSKITSSFSTNDLKQYLPASFKSICSRSQIPVSLNFQGLPLWPDIPTRISSLVYICFPRVVGLWKLGLGKISARSNPYLRFLNLIKKTNILYLIDSWYFVSCYVSRFSSFDHPSPGN